LGMNGILATLKGIYDSTLRTPYCLVFHYICTSVKHMNALTI
jgi:hypothetical protein